jgi:uncharacterized protein YndB with AHSA1/START domain
MPANNLIARVEETINAPVEKVWDAFVNPDVISKYMFGTKVTSDWTPGSQVTWEGKFQGKTYFDKGEILKIEPGKVLQYSHFTTMAGVKDKPDNYHIVTVEFLANGRKTKLVLTQENNSSREFAEHSEKNWRMMFHSLKELLEKI